MALLDKFSDDDLSYVATHRKASLFTRDVENSRDVLTERIGGKRLLILGGAGSIGASTLRELLKFRPHAVHVVDIGENPLAELTRDLRSQADIVLPPDLRFLPIDFGGPAMQRHLRDEPAYDHILHFAAHKHVRSEKDVPSLLQMLDTNVLKLDRFLRWLPLYGHEGAEIFAVSTDKAANPSSFMGASKRLMEHVLFDAGTQGATRRSTRFANVAFSNGSLPQAFLFRLARRQPLAAPDGSRRFFVSLRESGEICLLAACAAPAGHIAFPNLDPATNLRPLLEIAEGVLAHYGLKPAYYEDEAAAIRGVEADLARGHYPLIVTPLDTGGEKPYEEFVGAGESAAGIGLAELSGIPYAAYPVDLPAVIEELAALRDDVARDVTKRDVQQQLLRVVPGFRHAESERHLDQRA
ncbi:polysaccharide biosynthesis protein [Starkeya koreensis]|uniref:Polysaccharide biosynthesis protein n=1 Tax=Ancylobacter koreensis TaxID=266121 RepID=A0ABT0DKG5_9HYPH|nr:polysaccharide biosynthesis protein [Ancylobacter koreensis]MCK0207778.1 polysaccharide biosynthesis protein [Ancylobacter koreensis]